MFQKLKSMFRRKAEKLTEFRSNRGSMVSKSSEGKTHVSYSPTKEERKPRLVKIVTGRTSIRIPPVHRSSFGVLEEESAPARSEIDVCTKDSEVSDASNGGEHDTQSGYKKQPNLMSSVPSLNHKRNLSGTSRGSSEPLNYVDKLTQTLERRRKTRELAASLEKQYEQSVKPKINCAPVAPVIAHLPPVVPIRFLDSPVRAVDHDPWAELVAYANSGATAPILQMEDIQESSLHLSSSHADLREHKSVHQDHLPVTKSSSDDEYDIFEESSSRYEISSQHLISNAIDIHEGLSVIQQHGYLAGDEQDIRTSDNTLLHHLVTTKNVSNNEDYKKHRQHDSGCGPYTTHELSTNPNLVDTTYITTGSLVNHRDAVAPAPGSLINSGLTLDSNEISNSDLINSSSLTTITQNTALGDREFVHVGGNHFEQTLSPMLPLISNEDGNDRPSHADLLKYLQTYREAFHMVNRERNDAIEMASKFLKENTLLRQNNDDQSKQMSQLAADNQELQKINTEQNARLEHLRVLFAKHDETSRRYTDIIHKQAAENNVLQTRLASMNYQEGIARIQSQEMETMQQTIRAVRAGAASDVFSLVDYRSPYEGRTNLFSGSANSVKSAESEESITF